MDIIIDSRSARKYQWVKQFLLVLALPLALSACGGGSASSSETSSENSNSPPPPPGEVSPTVSLTANPSTITTNGTTTLTWSSTDASSCNASGGWSGSKPVSGSQSMGPVAASTTYTMTCTGAGGSAVKSVAVTVSTANKVFTLETSWAPNSDSPDGYTIYVGPTASSATTLVKTLVKGSSDWDPAAPMAQIPSTTVLAAVGSSLQACVQIKAFNAAGLSAPSQATCSNLP